jgi:hypothetical protein
VRHQAQEKVEEKAFIPEHRGVPLCAGVRKKAILFLIILSFLFQ